jgi:hypothetical protein
MGTTARSADRSGRTPGHAVANPRISLTTRRPPARCPPASSTSLGLRQSRGLHQMSEYAYHWNLAPALDRRGRVASAHDVGSSDEWDESRL